MGFDGAERQDIREIAPTEADQVEQNTALEPEHRETAHELAAHELAEAHDEKREPGGPAALGKGQADLPEILAESAEKARYHLYNPPK